MIYYVSGDCDDSLNTGVPILFATCDVLYQRTFIVNLSQMFFRLVVEGSLVVVGKGEEGGKEREKGRHGQTVSSTSHRNPSLSSF